MSGSAEMKLPVAANLALAALGVVAGALTLVWFAGLLGMQPKPAEPRA